MIEGFIMLGGVLLFLVLIFILNKLKDNKRKWKIRKGENYTQQYLELNENGKWRYISFDFETYAKGVPRHALYVKKNWGDYPDWAQMKKDEIIERLKSVLK
jgi:hypothetical protein